MKNKHYIVRKTAAIAVLGALMLATLVIGWNEGHCGGHFNWAFVHDAGLVQDVALVLFFLGVALYGIARERAWGRWVGLAVGLLALWKVSNQLFFDLLYEESPMIMVDWGQKIRAGGGVLLTASLFGTTMYDRFDGRIFGDLPSGRWDRFRLLAVRWSAVVAIALLPIIVASLRYGPPDCGALIPRRMHSPVLGILGAAVVLGIALIARGKTAGVIIIAGAGTTAAWLYGEVFYSTGELNWFEAANRAGHSLVFLLPALILAAPMLRTIFQRDR